MWYDKNMINLRPYQNRVVTELLDILSKQDKALLKAPTGSGKTIMAIATVISLPHTKDVIWLAHQGKLSEQAGFDLVNAFGAVKVNDNLYVLSDINVHLRTWQYFSKHVNKEHFDLVVIDECHQGSSYSKNSKHKSFHKILNSGNIKKHLYISATPFDLDSDVINNYASSNVSLSELEASNSICDVDIISVATEDTIKLKMTETDEGEIYVHGNQDHIVDTVVDKKVNIKNKLNQKQLRKCVTNSMLSVFFHNEVKDNIIPPTIIFARPGSDIKEPGTASYITKQIRKKLFDLKLPINLVQIDTMREGGTNTFQQDLRNGIIKILVVVRRGREGFDYKGLEVALDLCPSISNVRAQVQKLGRLMRISNGKTCGRYYYPNGIEYKIKQNGVSKVVDESLLSTLTNSIHMRNAEESLLIKETINTVVAARSSNEYEENIDIGFKEPVCQTLEMNSDCETLLANAMRVSNTKKVYTAKAGYIITACYSDSNPDVTQRTRLYDIIKTPTGGVDPQGNKQLIKDFYNQFKNFPKQSSSNYEEKRLSRLLSDYCCCKKEIFDLEFQKWAYSLGYSKNFKRFEEGKNQYISWCKQYNKAPSGKSADKKECELARWFAHIKFKNKNKFNIKIKFINEIMSSKWKQHPRNMKPIICNETKQIFESVRDAARKMNMSCGGLVTHLKKRKKAIKGFTFSYVKK